jgi:hypothetical protein
MDDKTKDWAAYWNGEPDDEDLREETKLKLKSEKVWDHFMDGDKPWCDDKCSCQKEKDGK